VRDYLDQPQFAVSILEDITDQIRMEADLIELKHRQVEGREMERVELSQELHDGPVQDLYGFSFHLKAYSDTLPEDVQKKPLQDMQVNLLQVVRKLRTICGELKPPTLVPFGLEKAIRSHVDMFMEEYPEISVMLDLEPDGQSLAETVRLALFRIYQQAVNNVARHSQAKNIWVRLKSMNGSILLEIQDNGKGFEFPERWIDLARQGHLGLLGASERAEAIGGSLKVDSKPGTGTLVQVTVPLSLAEGTYKLSPRRFSHS
jgi:signal transduction histidine kinase